MKILILSQYFTPEFAVIPNELATELSERGHQVRVLTTFPSYPSGKVTHGYRQKFRLEERLGKIQILRVPYFISRSRNPGLRMLSYISFALSATSAWNFAKGCDVIYVYATQMTPALAPSIWKRFTKTPFVLHIQDLWPESITQSGLFDKSIKVKVIEATLTPWLNLIYRQSARVIAIAPTMKLQLMKQNLSFDKVDCVYNWADESISPSVTLPPEIQAAFTAHIEKTRFVYSGNLGEMQNLEILLNAISEIDAPREGHFYFVGSGALEEKLKAHSVKLGLKNVTFTGRIDPEQMAAVYRNSDFQIISLKNLKIFQGTIPSKFQNAIFNGVPVLSVVPGDVKQIVESNNLGFTADPNDVKSIAEALKSATASSKQQREAMAQNATNFYQSQMSRMHGINRIESILESTINK